MDPQLSLAFEFAADLAKQLISLATGVLGLSVTFSKEIVKTPEPKLLKLLGSAWVVYLVSILSGIWSLMALTGTLAPLPSAVASGIGSNSRVPAAIQVVAFFVATLLFIAYGFRSLEKRAQASEVLDGTGAKKLGPH